METVREEARDIPVAAECDVCVVGGSCTGVFAAATAARLGADVVVVENNGFFGGTAAAGLVSVWHSLYDTTGQRQIIAGLTSQIIDRLHARGAAAIGDKSSPSSYCILNTEELKIELDTLVSEAHVRPFLHARFAAAVREGDRVTAAIIEDKSGRRAIRARVFIDATGDADIVARAAAPFEKRENLQPPTACALLHGLGALAAANPGFDLEQAVFDPALPGALARGFLWSAPHPSLDDVEMVAGTRIHGADASDADELTRAEIEGRRQVRAIMDLLRAGFKGGERLSLAALPSHIGVRETRHAHCLHRLTESDVLEGRRFDDAVAQGSYRVDIHYSDRPGLAFRYLDGREEYVEPGKPKVESRWRETVPEDPTFYQIPYRSLVPRGAANLLVAGRAIDADRGAYGAVRVMVNCNQTGEAAGAAAALALESDCRVDIVDTALLRRTLSDGGSIVI